MRKKYLIVSLVTALVLIAFHYICPFVLGIMASSALDRHHYVRARRLGRLSATLNRPVFTLDIVTYRSFQSPVADAIGQQNYDVAMKLAREWADYTYGTDASPFLWMGRCYGAQGEWDEANKAFRQALRIHQQGPYNQQVGYLVILRDLARSMAETGETNVCLLSFINGLDEDDRTQF